MQAFPFLIHLETLCPVAAAATSQYVWVFNIRLNFPFNNIWHFFEVWDLMSTWHEHHYLYLVTMHVNLAQNKSHCTRSGTAWKGLLVVSNQQRIILKICCSSQLCRLLFKAQVHCLNACPASLELHFLQLLCQAPFWTLQQLCVFREELKWKHYCLSNTKHPTDAVRGLSDKHSGMFNR